jgi:adenine/guanine/hypoxanthine permease
VSRRSRVSKIAIMGYSDMVHRANTWVASTKAGYYFRLSGSGHPKERPNSYFFTEIRAGLATFFAMAYIISVNATIVSQSGGTCVCARTPEDFTCDLDTEYMLCVGEVQRDLITATAAIAALTTVCMGVFANMPIALAPGMGLNAYFTFTVVGCKLPQPLNGLVTNMTQIMALVSFHMRSRSPLSSSKAGYSLA